MEKDNVTPLSSNTLIVLSPDLHSVISGFQHPGLIGLQFFTLKKQDDSGMNNFLLPSEM